MSDPIITVIIPTFNAATTIVRAIQSVQKQTFSSWEIIIINDCSSDSTYDCVSKEVQKDSRITCINLNKNFGQSNGRNIGIKLALGEWIAILDSDDAFTNNRLEVLYKLAIETNSDMVADNIAFFDEFTGEIVTNAMKDNDSIQEWTLEKHLKNDRLDKPFKWGLLQPLIKKSFLNSSSIHYRTQFRMAEDSLFYLELLTVGAKAFITSMPMYIYTTSIGKKSGKNSGHSTSVYKVEDHLEIFSFFENKYLNKLSPTIKKLLDSCRQDAITSDQAIRFRRSLFKALKLLFNNPYILKYQYISMIKYCKRKLGIY